jgi:endonuclease/exonuclease/phosphatase family metal-dependent hydrolase
MAGRLRIGTYNIAHGCGTGRRVWQVENKNTLLERLENMALILKRERLDVAVLNESDIDSFRTHGMSQARQIAERAEFPYWIEQRNIDVSLGLIRHRYGNAVLSRHPISSAQQVAFPGHACWETLLMGKKNGLLCTIGLPGGRDVRILAVHLEHRLESKRLAAARLMEEVRGTSATPLVLAGDFNSTRPEYPQAQCAGGQTAISWLLDSGAYRTLPSGPPQPEDYTFSSLSPDRVIDWILVPAAWTIMEKKVLASTLSDHRPVVMEVEMTETETN